MSENNNKNTTTATTDRNNDPSMIYLKGEVLRDDETEPTLVPVPRDAVQQCDFITSQIDGQDNENENEDNEEGSNHRKIVIEVPRFTSKEMQYISEFLKQTMKEPFPVILQNFETDFIEPTFEQTLPSTWYRNYIETMCQNDLFRLRRAANFMGLDQLYLLCNTYMAFQISKMKSVEEIRLYLRVEKMTPEEEKEAREKYAPLFVDEEHDLVE